MSNAQDHHTEEHQSPIKTPKQLITVVVLAIILPIVIIIMLANYVATGIRPNAGSNAMTTESVDARIAPVAGFALVDASAPRELLTGDAIYQRVCAACHEAGVAGAPKFGDNAAWAPHIQAGMAAMMEIAINGKGAMPPRGGMATLSDFELERAVVYMANASGGSFPEPVEPAAEGEAAATETPAAPSAPAAESAAQPAEQPAAAAEQSAPAQAADAAPAAAAPAAIAISDAAHTVGKKIYDTACFACHAAGVANAPKFGDKAAWEPHIATGMDVMLQVVINGKGAMPPRGMAMSASDDELRAAIEYMVAEVQ